MITKKLGSTTKSHPKKDEWISSQALEAARICDNSWIAGLGRCVTCSPLRCSKAK